MPTLKASPLVSRMVLEPLSKLVEVPLSFFLSSCRCVLASDRHRWIQLT